MFTDRSTCDILFAGQRLLLLASGGLFWPAEKMLVVSDLHLEKGSYLASQGQPIPRHDTRWSLVRLQELIQAYQPQSVLCLGDNVHDPGAFSRMHPEDLFFLQKLCDSVSSWHWIIGNHDQLTDTSFIPFKKMILQNTFSKADICFTHDLQPDEPFQIIGHYHPKISLYKRGIPVNSKCFSVTDHLVVMPAFGSYTGGLDVNHHVFQSIFKAPPKNYIIYNDNIWQVS